VPSLNKCYYANNSLDCMCPNNQLNTIKTILNYQYPSIWANINNENINSHNTNPETNTTPIWKTNLLKFAGNEAIDLLENLIKFDPLERMTAQQALQHPYLTDVSDLISDVVKNINALTISKFSSETAIQAN